MKITWSAVFLAIVAFPALAFYTSSRISPYFHRSFQRSQLLLQFTGYILGITVLHGVVMWLWNLCPALPTISLGRVLSWLETPPTPSVVDEHIPFITFYLIMVFLLGLGVGVSVRFLLLQAYARGLFPSLIRPQHTLSFEVASWAGVSTPGEYRLVVCHVLSSVLTDREQLLYRGILYDTEPSARGDAGGVSLWEPEKLRLDVHTGVLAEAGEFERIAKDSQLILSIPESNIQNILYEFIEEPIEEED